MNPETPAPQGNDLPLKPFLTIITGPTGVGKTALAIKLAERCGGEIISADSMQVYRYLDIGPAKPTQEERERVPHHLIDIVDPTPQTVDALMKLDLPAGVDVEIKT